MKFKFLIGALLLAAPLHAQSVKTGIELWQKGNHEAAVAVWTPLAAKGDADAAFNLGQAYRLGRGAPTDLTRAHQYFEQAASKGHIDAAATLGILLFQNGNRTGAMRWIKLAANGGEPRSLLLYGVAADPVSAYAYVSRAAAQGLASAKETLAEMDAAMTLDQRVKGLAMAKEMVSARQSSAAAPNAVAAKEAPFTPAPPKAVASAPSAAPSSGNWRIQLGAFGQRASAEALFARLRGKVGARQAYFVPVGKVTRLQVGSYESRAAAATACASLGGQACFPVAAR